MSANGASGVTWKPLLICPNADMAQKLSASWRAMAQPELIVESPRYIDRSTLGGLIGGHAVTLCFLDVGTDRHLAFDLVGALRDLRVPVAAQRPSRPPAAAKNSRPPLGCDAPFSAIVEPAQPRLYYRCLA